MANLHASAWPSDDAFSPAFFAERAQKAADEGARVFRFRLKRSNKRDTRDPATAGEAGEAKHFAARIKHHQGRQFAKRRREFRRQQMRLETQRRLIKAKAKARQFEAARRHAVRQRPAKRPRPIAP